jgi:peptidyl-prolyl cis-trans isomerase D
MLKTMRRNVKSLKPILWLVVATFIVAIFAIWGGGGLDRSGSGGAGTLASVGSEKISSDEYFQALRSRLEAMQKQFGDLNANLIQQLGVPQQTLEQLVQQRLLLQIAAGMGLRASDEEVRAKIVAYPVFQKDGKFIGFDEYKRVLDFNRIPLHDFETGLRQEVIIAKVVRVLTAGIVVTEEEVWESYRKQNDSAKIEYLVAETAKTEISEKPSETELRAHFDTNASRYKVPEKRAADYIVMKTDDLKKEVKVTDAEIEKYHRDNAAQFEEPEKVRAARIWLPSTAADRDTVLAGARDIQKRAKAGEDFAGLARQYSKDDKASAGGDWGLFDWRSLSAAEVEAVGKLDKDGVSEVVETDTGAAVFKVTEKDPAVTKALAEVGPTIKGILEDQKARALVAERIQRLEKLARKEKTLDVAAQKEGLKVSSTGPLKKGDPLGDFDSSGAVSEALFGLKDKEISAPVFTYSGEALAQLQAVEAERPATFEEARAEVESDILETLKRDRTVARLREARASLKDDWSGQATKLKLEYKFVEAHKKEQYLGLIGEKPEVDRLVFGLPIKQTSEPVAVDEGYALFRVLERKEVTREDFEKVKATEKDSVLEQEKNKFLQSYMAKVREDKKVEVDYEAFLRLTSDILSRFEKTP